MFVASHLRRSLRVLPSATSLSRVTVARWQSSVTAASEAIEDEVAQPNVEQEIKEANERQDLVSVLRTESHGWGVFARKNFEAGDLVISSSVLETLDAADSHSVQTDWNTHITMDLPARYVNHMCGPSNLGIRMNDKESFDYIALEEIDEGDELHWDYASSEYKVARRFACSCGAPTCRGQMLGFYKHGPEVMEAFGKDYVAPYLFTPNPNASN